MPSLIQCIDDGVAARLVSDQMALDLKDAVTGFTERHILEGKDPAAAKRMAQTDAIEAKMTQLKLQRRQKALQVIKIKEAIDAAQAHPKGFKRGVVSILTKDIDDILSESNINYRAKAILGQFHSKIARAMEQFRTKTLGFRQDIAGMRDVVREIEGVDTGNKIAKEFAEQISGVFDEARLRFNRAGGGIRKLENWFPHWWDPKLVKRISKEDFVDKFGSKLDRDRMINHLGIPMNNLELRILLERAYDDITTDGLASLEPGARGGTKMANRHQEHRVLIFKDVDDWLDLNDQFGRPDLYTTMNDHLSNMSHEIAMMEILGPNPQASYEYLRSMSKKKGANDVSLALLDAIWNVASGKVNNAVMTTVADFSRTTRSLLVAAQLGGAFLSSLNDPWIARMTAKINGIPSMKVFKEALRQFNPANKEDRIFAVEMGLVAEAWTTRALAANRFTEITGADFAAKAADATMRASLLSPWTDALRKGFGMAHFSQLAKDSAKAFKDLPKLRQQALKRYNISPEEWEILRKTKAIEHKGAKYWSIEKFLERSDLPTNQKNALIGKVQEMTLGEIDHAVLMPDFRSEAIATMGTRRGGTGEIIRFAAMYKSFPILMIMKQLYRGAALEGTANKINYIAQLTIGLTVFGAIALQAKDIAKGRNPRDMNDPNFWKAAFLQGGGTGIFGDFLFAETNRFGQSFMESLAGPVWGLGNDIWDITKGNVDQLTAGKDTNLSADMIQFLRRYTPGSSTWYIRGIFERTILDQLQKMLDPKAYEKFRRDVNKRKTEYGQSYWWKPGSSAPTESIDMSETGVF